MWRRRRANAAVGLAAGAWHGRGGSGDVGKQAREKSGARRASAGTRGGKTSVTRGPSAARRVGDAIVGRSARRRVLAAREDRTAAAKTRRMVIQCKWRGAY